MLWGGDVAKCHMLRMFIGGASIMKIFRGGDISKCYMLRMLVGGMCFLQGVLGWARS